jgi:hypothetical protein
MKNEASTRTGATNKAIWAADPTGDVHREADLVLHSEVDRDPVLGGVADDGDDDDTDEEGREPQALGRLGDGAHQNLRHHADGDPRARQHEDAAPNGPRLPAVILLVVTGIEQVFVGLEGEHQPGGVGDEQDHRHTDRQRLQVVSELHGPRRGIGQAAAGDQLEDRRHDQGDGGQEEHQRLR